jgi:hypothetical protein
VAKSTGSSDRLGKVKQLLHACRGHAKCNASSFGSKQNNRLPTRLLDLTQVRQTGIVRIILGEQLDQGSTYMTLSHCWGGIYPEVLRDLTLEDRTSGFQCPKLPPTFLEACLVALELGCFYLWIDALCILQGDELDWLRESPRMNEVFTNSQLTIAATSSANSLGGLFRKIQPTLLHHLRIPFSCDCTSAMITGEQVIGSWAFDQEVLHSRAWVIQEMSLSRRIAYFTDTSVHWVCMSTVSEDTREYPYPSFDLSRRIKPLVPLDIWTWNRLVETYTQCSLTKPTDRLIALAGLAGRCHRETQGQLGRYVAGMWEHRLAEQLGWITIGIKPRPAGLLTMLTWSWASVEHAVRLRMGEEHARTAHVKIEEILGPQDLGAFHVSGGVRLRVSARLLVMTISIDRPWTRDELRRLTIRNSKANRHLMGGTGVSQSAANVCDFILYETASESIQIHASLHSRGHQARLIFDEPLQVASASESLEMTFIIMPLWTAEGGYGGGLKWSGLIVRQTDQTSHPQRFCRVGVMTAEVGVVEKWPTKGYQGFGVEDERVLELV